MNDGSDLDHIVSSPEVVQEMNDPFEVSRLTSIIKPVLRIKSDIKKDNAEYL